MAKKKKAIKKVARKTAKEKATKKKVTEKKATKKTSSKKTYGGDTGQTGSDFNFASKDMVVAGAKSKVGFEEMDQSLIIIPRMTVIQPSGALTRDFPDTFKNGMLINNLTNDIMAKMNEPIYLQPVAFYPSRIAWIHPDEGGGIECQSQDGKAGDPSGKFSGQACKSCSYNRWTKNPNGKGTPPKCTMLLNFAFLYYGDFKEPRYLNKIDPMKIRQKLLWASFSKTSFKPGRTLINSLAQSDGNICDYWVELWASKSPSESYHFYVLNANKLQAVSPVIAKTGMNAYRFVKEMRKVLQFSGSDVEMGEPAGPDIKPNADIV